MSERTWLQQRNKLMIYMMLDAGLRRQEVLNLEIDNVDIINNLIKVKNSKGEKDRNVPLGNMTKRLFIKYINSRPLPAESTNCVFLTIDRLQITEDALKMVLQRIQKRLGFKKFNPHYLRHTFATKFIINQYEITGVADIELLREILGHESTRMCRAYLHLANQYLIKSHQFGVLANVKRKM
jgi:site-specific recombinase XerD